MATYDLKEIKEEIIVRLKNIYDPEIPVNIYDLGLIYNIEFEVRGEYLFCFITMTLTSPGCPVADSLFSQIKYVTLSVPEVDEVDVQITFEPMWNMTKISKEGQEILILNGAHVPQY